MKVENMLGRSGREVPNQFILSGERAVFGYSECPHFEAFQSYSSIIAVKGWDDRGRYTLLDRVYWDYSVTTGKYRNQFLGETKKETQAKINSGEYILTDLN